MGWGGGRPGGGVGWRAGGDPGGDHGRGAWAQVYQVVLCCLVQHLKGDREEKGRWPSTILNAHICRAFRVLLKLMNVTEFSQQIEIKEAYTFVEEIRLQSVCPLYTEIILCSS